MIQEEVGRLGISWRASAEGQEVRTHKAVALLTLGLLIMQQPLERPMEVGEGGTTMGKEVETGTKEVVKMVVVVEVAGSRCRTFDRSRRLSTRMTSKSRLSLETFRTGPRPNKFRNGRTA